MEVLGNAQHWIFANNDSNSSLLDAGWFHNPDSPDGIWTSNQNSSATLIFQGTELLLYSSKTPSSGSMTVICDDINDTVQLNETSNMYGQQVWQVGNLSVDTLHAIRVQMKDGGPINIEKVFIIPPGPTVIPPSTPSPLPSAFPQVKNVVKDQTQTQTVWETATITTRVTSTTLNTPSPPTKLPDGAMAGIIASGSVAAVSIIVVFALLLSRFLRNRREESERALKKLQIMNMNDEKRSFNGGNFSLVRGTDDDDIEARASQKSKKKSVLWFLPSIKRLSTLKFDLSTRASSLAPGSNRESFYTSVPLNVTPTPLPSAPQHARQSSTYQSRRLAQTLSIDTDVNSIRQDSRKGTVTSGRSFSAQKMLKPLKAASSFSVSDITDDVGKDTEDWIDVKDTDTDADFYAEQLSERFGPQEGPLMEEGDPIDRLDTPLILSSPAVASSNFSFSHSNSLSSRASHPSRRGKKILRSLRSPSSRRSSTLQSHGSSQRTPTTNSSHRAQSVDESPRSAKRNKLQLTPRMLNHPSSSGSDTLQNRRVEVPVANLVETANPITNTSALSALNYFTTSPRKMALPLTRTQKPVFGPRARSASTVSIGSFESNGSEGKWHRRSFSANEAPSGLSIVEETNSDRTSMSSSSMLT